MSTPPATATRVKTNARIVLCDSARAADRQQTVGGVRRQRPQPHGSNSTTQRLQGLAGTGAAGVARTQVTHVALIVRWRTVRLAKRVEVRACDRRSDTPRHVALPTRDFSAPRDEKANCAANIPNITGTPTLPLWRPRQVHTSTGAARGQVTPHVDVEAVDALSHATQAQPRHTVLKRKLFPKHGRHARRRTHPFTHTNQFQYYYVQSWQGSLTGAKPRISPVMIVGESSVRCNIRHRKRPRSGTRQRHPV